MGKKGNWFSSLKKALSPNSKQKKDKKLNKKWVPNENSSAPEASIVESVDISHPHPQPPVVEEVAEIKNEQPENSYSMGPLVEPAYTVTKTVQIAESSRFSGKSKEEMSAIQIQTAFRGYLARRALRALRGLVRLKTLVDGPTVKRQTANTLKCMQALSRVQAQICSRRLRMLEENRALQRQLLQKHAKDLESLRLGEEWDQSLQSKEKIEANLLHKYEATMRRERALAYSYSHQQTWKKSTRSANLLFMDPTNPHWGWSWLERLMATTAERELTNDPSSVKSASSNEITKSFARHQLNSDNTPSSPARTKPPAHHNHSPSTPKPGPSNAARKLKSASPKVSMSQDDDTRSLFSVQSEKNRRHSIAGSSVRDDESLASSPSLPSYMISTQSAKAKSRLQTPLGAENGTPEKSSGSGLVKKRLSYPPSPARPRRHSGPPKVDLTTTSTAEIQVNGGSS